MQKASANLKVRQVRTALGGISPFFAAIGLRMDIYFDPSVKTCTTDGRTIRVNEAWFETLDFDHSVGLLAQKSLQCALNHHIRMVGRDAALANRASQFVVNLEVLDAGYLLPKDHLWNPIYKGLSLERVYNILDQQREEAERNDESTEEGAGEEYETENAGQGDDDESDGQEEGEGDESQGAGDEEGEGEGGGSADGDGDGNPDQADYGGCGSIQTPRNDKGNPSDTAELAQHQHEWEVAAREAEMVQRRIGDMPGAALLVSEQLNEGQQDWRVILRAWMRSIIARGYTWLPSDRRFAHKGEYLPALSSKRIGMLGIGSDSSGSVLTQRQVMLITDEMNSALMEMMPRSTEIVYCDTVIQAIDVYTDQEYPIVLHFKGGGGTKCSPIFDYFDDAEQRPVGVIVFTDLEIDDFPAMQPAYPVLWASTAGNAAPWGDVLMLDEM